MKMQQLKVRFAPEQSNAIPNRGYDIFVGPGILEKAGTILPDFGLKTNTVIITDSTVSKLYSSILLHSLTACGIKVDILEVTPGEKTKSLETAAYLYTELTRVNAERSTTIIALGGGVIGDLAGFVAATYLRGVPLVQIPTTVLAQCDSSIGGKVAVNHNQLKNKIGTFYQPKLVLTDTNTLKTLTKREFSDGLAEVIKYGIIFDINFFNYLENNMDKILSLDAVALETIIAKSIEFKTRIVEQDEFDLGIRNILNYGHTIGHAIESNSDMTIWHGEAVAMGMIVEARLANKLGMMAETDVTRIERIISTARLPVEIPLHNTNNFLYLMQHDKKVSQGKIKFALPQGLGKVKMIDEIPNDIIMRVLEYKA